MCRVRTVDDEELRGPAGRRIDLLDRLGESHAARQAAVGLDREADDDRRANGARCLNHANSLLGIGHRQRRDAIDARLAQDADLPAVVLGGLVARHPLADDITIAARTEHSADRHVRAPFRERVGERCRIAICVRQLAGVVAQLRTPVGVRPPRRSVEHERQPALLRRVEEWLEVAADRCPATLVAEQRERSEARKIEALVKHQDGLDAAVSQRYCVTRHFRSS